MTDSISPILLMTVGLQKIGGIERVCVQGKSLKKARWGGGNKDYFDLINVGNTKIIIFNPLFHLELSVHSLQLIPN